MSRNTLTGAGKRSAPIIKNPPRTYSSNPSTCLSRRAGPEGRFDPSGRTERTLPVAYGVVGVWEDVTRDFGAVDVWVDVTGGFGAVGVWVDVSSGFDAVGVTVTATVDVA